MKCEHCAREYTEDDSPSDFFCNQECGIAHQREATKVAEKQDTILSREAAIERWKHAHPGEEVPEEMLNPAPKPVVYGYLGYLAAVIRRVNGQ